jgi:hypothetical protein
MVCVQRKIHTTIKATSMARNTIPPIPPAMAPTSVPVLTAFELLGEEVCMLPSWEEELKVVVTVWKVEDGGGEGVDEDVVVVVVEPGD